MPNLFQYHIFISHAWRYSTDYDKLKQLLDNNSYFTYFDYSISRDKSLTPRGITVPDDKIKTALKTQISHATVVLILLGMYGAYHEWMGVEAGLALSMNKPLIGIRPWGQSNTPAAITLACNKIVSWSTASIISAIRDAR